MRIRTERLTIKPVNADELKDLVYSLTYLTDFYSYTIPVNVISPEITSIIQQDIIPLVEENYHYYLFYTPWLIFREDTREMVGQFSINGPPDNKGRIFISFGLHFEARGKGYMSEALSAIIEWLRKEEPVKIIAAEVENNNIPALGLLKKLGFEIITKTANLRLMERAL